MVFPVMNVITSFKESGFDHFDSIKGIIRKAQRLEPVIGAMVLMSNGELKKGHEAYLITKIGCFNISEGDT